jgi:protein-S-isoprenylcysteine O-methyltransferase Ste14
MSFWGDPFFWALLSMFSLVASCAGVGVPRLAERPLLGATVVVFFVIGRIVLVLPVCPQPRFAAGGWSTTLGAVVFAAGLGFCLAALRIRPFTAPDGTIELQTTGLYGMVRNPIYLGELLWSLGWAVMFRSVVGIALTPFWWAGLLLLTLIEEQSLERELGEVYLGYKQRVRGRIIPGLPI